MATEVHVHVHIHDDPDGLTPRVESLEETVGVLDERIIALNTKVEEYNQDVQAALQVLRDAIAANDPAAISAALDALETTVASGVDAVGDADGDGTPAPVVPTP